MTISAAAPAAGGLHLRRPMLRVVLSLGAIAALLIAAGYWVFDAHELSTYRPQQYGVGPVMRVGETNYISQDIGPTPAPIHDAVITLRKLDAVVPINRAGASVRVLVCIGAKEGGGGSGPASLADLCRTARPLAAAGQRFDGTRDQLVLAVTPTRPGLVDLAGVRVSYRDGIRRGDQLTGQQYFIHVRGYLTPPPR